MNNLKNTVLIQINLFIIFFAFIFLLCQLLVQPVWETAVCGKTFCYTTEHHIIYSRLHKISFEKIELEEVKDKIFNISQYFFRTRQKYVNGLVFSSGYFSKKNAERDLYIIKNNDYSTLTKRNTGHILFVCICLYIIFQSFGILCITLIKFSKENENKSSQVEQLPFNSTDIDNI